HRQSGERLRSDQAGQRAGARPAFRNRGTEHGDDVLRHVAGYAAGRVPAHDGLRHLRRIHVHDGESGAHTLINNEVNPSASAFFVMLAAHDGLETGEDGPTHHGLFWMSLYTAYPGIKVYKPLDANEAVEMLFLAAQRGEPVAFSCTRPGTPVLKRGDGVPAAREAIDGAYVFKPFRENGKPKKVLAICGGQVMHN